MVVLPALDSRWLEGPARPIALVVGFAIIAIIALFVASAAMLKGQRQRGSNALDDEELFTTTPLPMAKEELARLKRQTPYAFSGVGIPR